MIFYMGAINFILHGILTKKCVIDCFKDVFVRDKCLESKSK